MFQPKSNMLEYITSPKLKSLLWLQTSGHPIPSRSNVSQKALVVNVHLTQLACMALIWGFRWGNPHPQNSFELNTSFFVVLN